MGAEVHVVFEELWLFKFADFAGSLSQRLVDRGKVGRWHMTVALGCIHLTKERLRT